MSHGADTLAVSPEMDTQCTHKQTPRAHPHIHTSTHTHTHISLFFFLKKTSSLYLSERINPHNVSQADAGQRPTVRETGCKIG